MRVNGYKFPIWLVVFIIISAVGALISIWYFIEIRTHAFDASRYFLTPFDYSYDMGDIHENKACPGESLIFDYTIVVDHDGPFVARITETWTMLDGTHVIFDADPVWANQIGPIEITRTSNVKIPDLPPGDYYYRRGAALPPTSGSPAMLEVPVTVLGNCD
jgi:hypothetical protein